MEGELEPRPHAGQLRISDADRHRLADFLRDAAGEGRLDLDELEERLGAAYAAKTYDDLVPLVLDLPGGAGLAPTPPPVAPQPWTGRAAALPADLPVHASSLAILGGQDRKGVWAVGPAHQAFTLMGGIDLDLREAVFTVPEVVITANAVMGAVDIVVNAGTRVVVEGVGIMGAFEEGRAKVPPEFGPDSPLVRVRGIALMGAVTVVRKPMPGRKRKLLGRAPE